MCQPGSWHSRLTHTNKLEARGKGSSTPSIIKSDTEKECLLVDSKVEVG